MHCQANELKITMMDVEKQSNGYERGILAIAYAFEICSGHNPCSSRFDLGHTLQLAWKIAMSRFPVLGEQKGVLRNPRAV